MNERAVPVIPSQPITSVHLRYFAAAALRSNKSHSLLSSLSEQLSPSGGSREAPSSTHDLPPPRPQPAGATMPLKKTVAMERRIDLASLFCLIARHGPAVFVTLLVIGCSLAGFIMLRNRREKRRRRADGGDRRDSYPGQSEAVGALGLGEDEEPCAEEEVSLTGSTDPGDEEFTHQAHVRHRRVSSERNLYQDKQADGATARDKETYSFFWNRISPKATKRGETRYSPERNFSHTSNEDMTEDACGDKQPGLTNDVGYEEKEKVIEADSSEDITSTTEDVSDEEFTQEETVHFTFDSQSCSAPAPILGVNNDKDNEEEAILQPQEPELQSSVACVLKQDEILSAPHVKHEKVSSNQIHSESAQNTLLHCDEPITMEHCENGPQADMFAVSVEMVMDKDLVQARNEKTCDSEPLKLEDTNGDCNLVTSADLPAVAELSSNSQQSEPLMAPAVDMGIDLNGLCPDYDRNDFGLVNTESSKATFNDDVSNVEAAPDSLGISVAVANGLGHQGTIKRAEAETSLLSENTSAVQRRGTPDILPHVENDKVHMDNLSDQKDSCEEQKSLPIREENATVVNQTQDKSSPVDLKQEECLVQPLATQNLLHEVMEEETSSPGLTSNASEEKSTVTDTTAQTNTEEPLERTPDTSLPPSLPSLMSESESNDICPKDENMSTSNISAATRDKIEIMVEQMVAEVYKDVTQSGLEAKSIQVEEKKSSERVQNIDGIPCDNLACKEVEIEVIYNQAPSAEKTVCSVTYQSNSKTVENDVQKHVLVTSDASENRHPNTCSNGDILPPASEAESNLKVHDNLDETARNLDNVASEMSESSHSVEQMAIEIKPTLLDQSMSLEHFDEFTVQPVLGINNGVSNNITVEVVKQETQTQNVCSDLGAPVHEEATITSHLGESNFEKVEVEEKIQSENEHKTEESVTVSNHFDQKELEVAQKVESNKMLEKEESVHEIPSSLQTEVSEITEVPNEVQSEPKEFGMCLDIGHNSSSVTTKSSKVVIVCRTLEACVSTTELSDNEEVEFDVETPHLELTSKFDPCQDHTDTNKYSANKEASTDTLTAQTTIKEMTTEEEESTESGKPLDLTSHVSLDILQDSGESKESAKQTDLKDDSGSTPSLESGISSLTVSPEEEDSRDVTNKDTSTTQDSAKENSSCGFVLVAKEDVVALENSPQSPLQNSLLEDPSSETSMINEDSFGSEIEDDYHKTTEELMTQFLDNIKATSENMTKETAKLERKDSACANKENGEKVDSEKTEISIMEATMDHNEWITDGNYQVLPWMTTASVSKDSSSSSEAKDAVESKPQASNTDESVESAKKVLAVQPMPQNVDVTFRVHYVTLTPYQSVAVTGDQPELGSWKSVIPLVKTKDGYWTCVVSLPPESHVQWKFVVLEKGEVCRWEECGNRLLYTGYGDDLLVHKWWGFL